MQRVRIGLTGLALVFLLVLLGAVIRSFSNEEPSAANLADRSATGDALANGEEPTEPLAQLGVAPGNTDPENSASNPAGPAKK
jgi:hypothetical protein